MTTQEKISQLITNRYGDYKGTMFHHLKELHEEIRESAGDERFLSFLEADERGNPRPIYSIPDEYFQHKRHN